MRTIQRRRGMKALLSSALLIFIWAFFQPESAQAQWTTNGTNINNSNTGNVGIGIGNNAPAEKLELSGNLLLTGTVKGGLKIAPLSPDAVVRFGLNMPNLLGEGDNARRGGFLSFDTRSNQSAIAFWLKQPNSSTEVEVFSITDTGNVGIGTTSPGGRLTLFGNLSSAAWGINGIQFRGQASTYTDTSSTGTVASIVGSSFAAPTFAATNSTTYTTASTLYIAGSPIPSTNVTITNPLSLNVATGNSYLGGNLGIGVTNQTAKLAVYGGISSTTVADILSASNTTAMPLRIRNNSSASSGSLNQGAALEFALQKTINGVESTQTGAMIRLGKDGDWVAADETDTDSNLTFFTVNNGTLAEAMRINSAGNIGIGTTTPAYKLDVAGQINTTQGFCISGICKSTWADIGGGASQWTTSSTNIYYSTGNVGIGTQSPGKALVVQNDAADNQLSIVRPTTNAATLNIGIDNTGPFLESVTANKPISFYTNNGTSIAERVRIDKNGNLGINTTTPQQKLQIGSNVSTGTATPDAISLGATYSSTAGANPKLRLWDNNAGTTYGMGVSINQFDFMIPTGARYVWNINGAEKMRLDENGDITVSGNINAKYRDVAEWVSSSQKLAGGTVVILDPEKADQVIASRESYDTRVAGVVSDNPGVILGEGGEGKVKVATTGRVKVKVDASRGPIKIGDLLVTSDKEGMAMKSEPINFNGRLIHSPGTIIGKALEPLEKGEGEILVLLSLQ